MADDRLIKVTRSKNEYGLTRAKPYRPVCPGEILKEELDSRGWTQANFADITGKPVPAISEIISGKKPITPEMADLFSEALGTSSEFWVNLELSYKSDLVKQKTVTEKGN